MMKSPRAAAREPTLRGHQSGGGFLKPTISNLQEYEYKNEDVAIFRRRSWPKSIGKWLCTW